MSILKNAVESIQVGMEDYHDDDPRRVLSAIRNLYAGILLLFKHKLKELSPDGSDEALLKTKVSPEINPDTGEVTWVGRGKKTVEVGDIIDRLKSLNIGGIEWQRLEDLQKIRNEIEHYYSQLPVERLKEAVANALHLITQFCEPHLDQQPGVILGQECWDHMLSVATVYDAELKACRDNLESVEWPFDDVAASIPAMRCPACDSQLLKVMDTSAKRDGIEFMCSSCQTQSAYSEVVGAAISNHMAGWNYMNVKDGGEPVTSDCPECGADTFLRSEQACAACFYEQEYTQCEMCEEPLTVEDQWLDGKCSYCQYKYDKMMAE